MNIHVKIFGGGGINKLYPFYLSMVVEPTAMESIVEICDDAFENKTSKMPNYSDLLSKWKASGTMLCVRNDNIKGYIVLYANDFQTKKAFISMLGVRPLYQKQGCGKYLIQACEEIARERMMKTLTLEVKKNNINALGFYKHLGFEETFEKEESFFYTKDLGNF